MYLIYRGGMKRHDLTEAQWERLQQFLLPQKPRVGRPNHDHRRILNGILWIPKTGAPWRDLPERFGPWNSVWKRFDRWSKKGTWQRVFEALQDPDLEWLILDATVIRATRTPPAPKKPRVPNSTRAWRLSEDFACLSRADREVSA